MAYTGQYAGGCGGAEAGGDKSKLVEQVKAWQRRSDGHKQAWYNFVAQQGSMNYDPNRHDASVLERFLTATENGELDVVADACGAALSSGSSSGGGGGGDEGEKAALVDRVKEWQRKGETYKQSWYDFVMKQGSSSYDPNRHDSGTLSRFLRAAESGTLDAAPGAGAGPGGSWDNGWCSGWGGCSGCGCGWDGWGPGCWDTSWWGVPPWYAAYGKGVVGMHGGKGMMDGKGIMMDCGKGMIGYGVSPYGQGCSMGDPFGCTGGPMCDPMGGKGKDHPNRKPGDWICPACGDLVFAKKKECSMCRTPVNPCPSSRVSGPAAGRPGDWVCGDCQNVNFSYRSECNKCGNVRSTTARLGVKAGDWICPSCGDLVFASKSQCKMCQAPKPEGEELAAAERAAQGAGAEGGRSGALGCYGAVVGAPAAFRGGRSSPY